MSETDGYQFFFIDLDQRTVSCADGITRNIHSMYDHKAQETQDQTEAIAIVVEISENKFILLDLISAEYMTPQ